MAKRYHCQCVVDIADLWPESLAAYGYINRKNPLLKLMYQGEKWIYRKADQIIFTMEGGKEYIKEKKWDKQIARQKIHHLNNGIDLEQFDYNKVNYKVKDADLEDEKTFKIVYVGSIREVNHLETIVECADVLQNKLNETDVKFLIWGEGCDRERLERSCHCLGLNNIVFKGKVDKKYIPYILTKSNLNYMHGQSNEIARFGMSSNKLFDYMASGKAILSDIGGHYDLITRYGCGFSKRMSDATEIVEEIERLKKQDLSAAGNHARICAEAYDFKNITEKLNEILAGCAPH